MDLASQFKVYGLFPEPISKVYTPRCNIFLPSAKLSLEKNHQMQYKNVNVILLVFS